MRIVTAQVLPLYASLDLAAVGGRLATAEELARRFQQPRGAVGPLGTPGARVPPPANSYTAGAVYELKIRLSDILVQIL